MSEPDVVVAIYHALTGCGVKNPIEKTRLAARAIGVKARNTTITEWLSGTKRERNGNGDLSTTGTDRELNGNSRANKELVYISPSLRSGDDTTLRSVSAEQLGTQCLDTTLPGILATGARASRGTRVPKSLTLPLDAKKLDQRRAILNALWVAIQPHIGRAVTKTDWVSRNSRSAMSLAELGRTPAECLAAWESASRRLGEPVRSVRIVQDELSRAKQRLVSVQATEDEMDLAIRQGFA